ncbi:transposase [Candidatus Protochlamydia amoebophila]
MESLKSHAKWGKTTIGWFFGFKLHLMRLIIRQKLSHLN